MSAEKRDKALAEVAKRPRDPEPWLELARWVARIPGELPTLSRELREALCRHALDRPGEASLGTLLLRVLGLEPAARPRDELAESWRSSERLEAVGQVWVDSLTGLPVAARRQRDGAEMTLVGRVEGGGVAYIDRAPVSARGYRHFLDETKHRATPPWREASGPWADPEGLADLPATCVTREDAAAYARWAGGALPDVRLWYVGGLVHCAESWTSMDRYPEARAQDLDEDYEAEWPAGPRAGHTPMGPASASWVEELRALDALEGPGAWGRIPEWTGSRSAWPGMPSFSDNYLWIDESNAWNARIAARTSELAHVVVIPERTLPAFGPKLVGANDGDHDPYLGFRVSIFLGEAKSEHLERVWKVRRDSRSELEKEFGPEGSPEWEAEAARRRRIWGLDQEPKPWTTEDKLGCARFLAFWLLVIFGPTLIYRWFFR